MPSYRFRTRFAVCILAMSGLSGPPVSWAQESAAADASQLVPGHSYHGETFDDGPRQKAYLMGSTGAVSFPVTSAHPEVQKFINQGVGQLHGFWYFEAERSFRQAAALDPKCAMAYWGMALANTNNTKRAKGFIAEAVKHKAGISDREALFIDALDAFHKADPKKDKERYEAYTKALEKIVYKNPDDIEAKALLGLQLWLNRSHGHPIVSYLAIDALLNDVIAVEPLHPCHHYRIHLWDVDKEKSALALNSAARCGQGSPGIAHMWHMPGHTYSKLERYHDAVWQQDASGRTDHAYMISDRIMPDQIHNYAHNQEWMIRNMGHIGRVHDGIAMARNFIEMPRHSKYNNVGKGGSANFGRLRLFEELTRFELWDELIALAEGPYLEPTDVAAEQIKRLRTLGAAYIRKGDLDQGKAQLAQLEERLRKERPEAVAAAAGPSAGVSSAEPRPEPVPLPVCAEPKDKKPNPLVKPLELAIDELKGHLAVADGDYKSALTLLKRAGGVDALYLARLELLAGNRDEALKSARSAVNSKSNQTQPLAGLIFVLWEAGEKKEAEERFQKLRDMSSSIDLDVPPFARLAPIAAALGLPSDWRLPRTPANDVGNRPPLDSLGPTLWSPPAAIDWTLPDTDGKPVALSQYRGKPVVVIFYLGHACLHCAEQLQKFAPLTQEYADAGISLLGVSTDSQADLKLAWKNFNEGAFPFPLVSDNELNVFKACRAFDDFENQALHATFFIDADGLVRWQDISYEPFMDPRFLLNEAKRLMNVSAANKARPAHASSILTD
jgi:peroxiredoxin/tetratricopeptide (TPR) repeat protein